MMEDKDKKNWESGEKFNFLSKSIALNEDMEQCVTISVNELEEFIRKICREEIIQFEKLMQEK